MNTFCVKDLVNLLKENIIILIELGPDDNNFSHQTIYREEEHGHRIVKDIYFIDEIGIGIEVL